MTPIIEVKNVGKRYDIRHYKGQYVTLRDVLTSILKSPFNFAKQKVKGLAGAKTKEHFWALNNVSFEVNPGEVIGIIGRNGAGKSTLLKILTGITPPTTGEIVMRGRPASLLEVGTGFHPELTGRENIFLNGAILGMKKKEIIKNFDSIVNFAGIEKFADTPVKFYSSGMYVRLAFSVAAHMEPDILLVDEVLAVGDAEFQKKCLGKMEEVTRVDGRTILFVSHNMAAIRRLCKKVVLLEKGEIAMVGPTEKVINRYLGSAKLDSSVSFRVNRDKEAQVSKVTISNDKFAPDIQIEIGRDFFIDIEYEILRPAKNLLLSLIFQANGDTFLLSSESDKSGRLNRYEPGQYRTRIKIPGHLFNVGLYSFEIRLHRPQLEMVDQKTNLNFEIVDIPENPRSVVFGGHFMGPADAVLDYETIKTR